MSGAEASRKPREIEVKEGFGPFALLPDNTLVTFYLKGDRVLHWRDTSIPQHLYCRRSDDLGATWGESEFVYDLGRGPGFTGPGPCATDREGNPHAFGLLYRWGLGEPMEGKVVDMWHHSSEDGGKTWSEPQWIDHGYEYIGSLNEVTVLGSGRMLVPFSYLSNRKTGLFVSTVILSDDNGLTWRNARNDLELDTGGRHAESGAAEPVTVELPDGRVWMLIRTQAGRLFESYSEDGGESWSQPSASIFRSSNSPAYLLRLRDGRVMMCWNNSIQDFHSCVSYSRQSLVAAIQGLDGKWRGYREIGHLRPGDYPGCSLTYPLMAELPDGNVLVQHVQSEYLNVGSDDQPRIRKFVHPKLRIVSPDWVVETECTEEWREGLSDWTLTPSGPELESDATGAKAMRLNRPGPDAASGAAWNFPFSVRGEMRMRVMIEEGFQGVSIMLSETHLKPGNREGGMFRFRIQPDGRIALQTGNNGVWAPVTFGSTVFTFIQDDIPFPFRVWHDLLITWNCRDEYANIWVNGQPYATLIQMEQGRGIAYVRLSADAPGIEQKGLRVETVQATVLEV